jgi:hypothetical protein
MLEDRWSAPKPCTRLVAAKPDILRPQFAKTPRRLWSIAQNSKLHKAAVQNERIFNGEVAVVFIVDGAFDSMYVCHRRYRHALCLTRVQPADDDDVAPEGIKIKPLDSDEVPEMFVSYDVFAQHFDAVQGGISVEVRFHFVWQSLGGGGVLALFDGDAEAALRLVDAAFACDKKIPTPPRPRPSASATPGAPLLALPFDSDSGPVAAAAVAAGGADEDDVDSLADLFEEHMEDFLRDSDDDDADGGHVDVEFEATEGTVKAFMIEEAIHGEEPAGVDVEDLAKLFEKHDAEAAAADDILDEHVGRELLKDEGVRMLAMPPAVLEVSHALASLNTEQLRRCFDRFYKEAQFGYELWSEWRSHCDDALNLENLSLIQHRRGGPDHAVGECVSVDFLGWSSLEDRRGRLYHIDANTRCVQVGVQSKPMYRVLTYLEEDGVEIIIPDVGCGRAKAKHARPEIPMWVLELKMRWDRALMHMSVGVEPLGSCDVCGGVHQQSGFGPMVCCSVCFLNIHNTCGSHLLENFRDLTMAMKRKEELSRLQPVMGPCGGAMVHTRVIDSNHIFRRLYIFIEVIVLISWRLRKCCMFLTERNYEMHELRHRVNKQALFHVMSCT